jgi:hypothetical protein
MHNKVHAAPDYNEAVPRVRSDFGRDELPLMPTEHCNRNPRLPPHVFSAVILVHYALISF